MFGDTYYDYTGKFRIVLGPLKREVYETFLPGTPNIEKIKSLVNLYIPEPFEYDIEVQLQSTDLVPVALGLDNTRLGETSSLGKTEGKTDIQSIIVH